MQAHIKRKLSKEERLTCVEGIYKEEKGKLADMVFAPLWHNASL
jgi:hypothetical protein